MGGGYETSWFVLLIICFACLLCQGYCKSTFGCSQGAVCFFSFADAVWGTNFSRPLRNLTISKDGYVQVKEFLPKNDIKCRWSCGSFCFFICQMFFSSESFCSWGFLLKTQERNLLPQFASWCCWQDAVFWVFFVVPDETFLHHSTQLKWKGPLWFVAEQPQRPKLVNLCTK